LLAMLGLVYLGLAVMGQVRELSGELTCTCADDCWCKKPGPSLFRWVFPYGHISALPEQEDLAENEH
jgi:hypothetical protein